MEKRDWEAILAEYEARDCTQEEFCRRKGLKKVTLQYQLSKLKKRQSFIEVPATLSSVRKPSVMIEFPNGLKLSVDGSQ